MRKRSLVGAGTGFSSGITCSYLYGQASNREIRLVPHVAFFVEGYPPTNRQKYGTVTLGAAATRPVALSAHASGKVIRKWPHHVLVTSSVSLTGASTVSIVGRDQHGRPNTSTFQITGATGWYSPLGFSRIDYITVNDDGSNSGAILRFGDGFPGQEAAWPMFSLPVPLVHSFSVYNAFYRPSKSVEWILANNPTELVRDRPNGVLTGGIRPSRLDGEPDSSMGIMVLLRPLHMEGEPI